MSTNAAFPPYEYYEGDQIAGIDIELTEAIAAKLGLTAKVEDMEFDSIIPAIQQGKADLGLAGMTVTEERLEAVNFTTSYTSSRRVPATPSGSSATPPATSTPPAIWRRRGWPPLTATAGAPTRSRPCSPARWTAWSSTMSPPRPLSPPTRA